MEWLVGFACASLMEKGGSIPLVCELFQGTDLYTYTFFYRRATIFINRHKQKLSSVENNMHISVTA